MVFVIRIVVDGDLVVALRLEEAFGNIKGLHEIALTVGRGSVGTGQAGLHFASVWGMVPPGRRPAIPSRKVAVGGVPVQTVVDPEHCI